MQNKKIDVLYIHPIGENPSFSKPYFKGKKYNNSSHYFGFIPVGVIGIINNLIDNGISCIGINFPIKKRINPSFDLEEYIRKLNPQVILIDMHWYVHIKNGINLAKISKSISDCKVIVGGMSATIFVDELIKIPEIDFIVKGDAEKPAKELISAILKKENVKNIENITGKGFNNIITYCCPDIDEYDYASVDFLEDKEAYLNLFDSWLLTGKGCPYNCVCCDGAKKNSSRIYMRPNIILRNPASVITDLKKIDSTTVGFSLDYELCKIELINKLSTKKYACSLRNEFFQLADLKKLDKLKNTFSGFDLVFSPVSGEDIERKKYGKLFSNKNFLAMLSELDKLTFNCGVIIYFSSYMVYPKKAVKLNEEARLKLISKIEEVSPSALIEVMPQIVDPGTLIEEMDIKELFKYYST